jgi:hypothetical protein
MPGNAVAAQWTTMPCITKVTWWKTTMPIAKVAQQTTTPLIPMAVREKTKLPIDAYQHGSAAKDNTKYCNGGMADNNTA